MIAVQRVRAWNMAIAVMGIVARVYEDDQTFLIARIVKKFLRFGAANGLQAFGLDSTIDLRTRRVLTGWRCGSCSGPCDRGRHDGRGGLGKIIRRQLKPSRRESVGGESETCGSYHHRHSFQQNGGNGPSGLHGGCPRDGLQPSADSDALPQTAWETGTASLES